MITMGEVSALGREGRRGFGGSSENDKENGENDKQ
jgi:hypothetical protein